MRLYRRLVIVWADTYAPQSRRRTLDARPQERRRLSPVLNGLKQDKKRLSAFPKGAVQKATDLTYIAFDPREPGDAESEGGDGAERVLESEAMLGERACGLMSAT